MQVLSGAEVNKVVFMCVRVSVFVCLWDLPGRGDPCLFLSSEHMHVSGPGCCFVPLHLSTYSFSVSECTKLEVYLFGV